MRLGGFCGSPLFAPSCTHDLPIVSRVVGVCKHDRQVYWDLHVPGVENYLSNGMVNHNSGKSHFFDVVCVREIQKSLAQSVKKLIEAKIEALGVGSLFQVQESVIKAPHGGTIIFQGMQNHTADSIKSLEGFDIAWCEESQSLSQRSLDLLRPTIRKPGSELWFSWNPGKETDPIDVFLRGPQLPPGAVVVEVNHHDNPWFPDVLRVEMEYDKSRDPDKYSHVWLGQYERRSEARVFRNWRVEAFDTPTGAVHRLGADWGFASDPTALVRCHIAGRTLFVDHEAVMVGCEIDMTPELFDRVPESRKWFITADSSRPETISYMRKHGYPRINAAIKGARSVEEGVEFLKSFDIVVHPRCERTIDELTLYSYKTDPLTGKVLPVLGDKNNHVIDALRYACEGVRKADEGKRRPGVARNFAPADSGAGY
jgi:phage terminase large subunit